MDAFSFLAGVLAAWLGSLVMLAALLVAERVVADRHYRREVRRVWAHRQAHARR